MLVLQVPGGANVSTSVPCRCSWTFQCSTHPSFIHSSILYPSIHPSIPSPHLYLVGVVEPFTVALRGNHIFISKHKRGRSHETVKQKQTSVVTVQTDVEHLLAEGLLWLVFTSHSDTLVNVGESWCESQTFNTKVLSELISQLLLSLSGETVPWFPNSPSMKLNMNMKFLFVFLKKHSCWC